MTELRVKLEERWERGTVAKLGTEPSIILYCWVHDPNDRGFDQWLPCIVEFSKPDALHVLRAKPVGIECTVQDSRLLAVVQSVDAMELLLCVHDDIGKQSEQGSPIIVLGMVQQPQQEPINPN